MVVGKTPQPWNLLKATASIHVRAKSLLFSLYIDLCFFDHSGIRTSVNRFLRRVLRSYEYPVGLTREIRISKIGQRWKAELRGRDLVNTFPNVRRTAIHVRRIPKDVRLRDVAWAWIVIDTHRGNIPLLVKVLGAVCKFEDHIRRIDLLVEHGYLERYRTRIRTLDNMVQENYRLRSTDHLIRKYRCYSATLCRPRS